MQDLTNYDSNNPNSLHGPQNLIFEDPSKSISGKSSIIYNAFQPVVMRAEPSQEEKNILFNYYNMYSQSNK